MARLTLGSSSRGWAGLGGLPMLFNLSLPAGDVREGMQLYPILEGLAKWIIGCVLRQVTSGRGLRQLRQDCHLSGASPRFPPPIRRPFAAQRRALAAGSLDRGHRWRLHRWILSSTATPPLFGWAPPKSR